MFLETTNELMRFAPSDILNDSGNNGSRKISKDDAKYFIGLSEEKEMREFVSRCLLFGRECKCENSLESAKAARLILISALRAHKLSREERVSREDLCRIGVRFISEDETEYAEYSATVPKGAYSDFLIKAFHYWGYEILPIREKNCSELDISIRIMQYDEKDGARCAINLVNILVALHIHDLRIQVFDCIPVVVSNSVISSIWWFLFILLEDGKVYECAECKRPFIATNNHERLYCGDRCRKARANREAYAKRKEKLSNARKGADDRADHGQPERR